MTRHDYQYMREHAVTGWQDMWLRLLAGRFFVSGDELVEDENAEIFRLGFSVDEVATAIGHSGYTAPEQQWYGSQPDRYTLDGDTYIEVTGWRAQYDATRLIAAINERTDEVDRLVAEAQARPFSHDGHLYYSDRTSIQGMLDALDLLPADYTRQWKTAEKPDGLNNVYVELDVAGIKALAKTYFDHYISLRDQGEQLKLQLKQQTSVDAVEQFSLAL